MHAGNQENRNSKEIILGVERTYEKHCQYEDKEKAAKFVYIFYTNIQLRRMDNRQRSSKKNNCI